ncbi:MAG: nucleotidyltransferase family protein [Bacteroidales bacterium]|nr:nucleotidyltransferase family protein [Bacteroidales bacterium]MCI2121287.1 nucleotidyltransferase family protein [Bacteroidales bacterium]MCI2145223.1 nucleotidyltransferase family protein [Bacteroidales bacterium]
MPKHKGYPDKESLTLLLLLRRALSGSAELPEELTEAEWKSVCNLSVECGVHALAYDGLLDLPEGLQPPRAIKIHWAVDTAAIEDKYARHKDVIVHLNGFMRAKKMRMLLLNGLGNASNYPVPEHREGSDIDIYTFDESFMVDKMISDRGIAVVAAPNFSSDFFIQGVLVENHHHFFNVKASPLNRIFEEKVQSLVSSDTSGNRIFNEINLPAPQAEIYLMSLRILNKFAMGSATLRQLCDWTTFLKANALRINFKKFNDFLRENDLYEAVSRMNEICIAYLGLDSTFRMPSANRSQSVETEMLNRMLNVRKHVRRRKLTFREKLSTLHEISWNYHLVHNDHSFWIIVLKTLFS